MTLLPIHPQPKEGEILSSWMVRLSIANHFQLHTFYSKLLGYDHPIWNRDVDRNPAPELLNILADSTGCPLKRINTMTLGYFDGLLYEDVRLHGVAKWILPIGVFHRVHRRRGMQCCPLCLKEGIPFFCLKWRVSLFTLCEVHRCLLIDACPRCGATIEYHRLGIARGEVIRHTALTTCAGCGFDLSTAPVEMPGRLPERVVSEYVKILQMVAKNRWGDALQLPAAYPLSFFDGLKMMLRLVNKRSATALRERINAEFPIGLVVAPEIMEFGYRSILQRFKLIVTCLWLLHDWPNRFVSIVRDAHLSRSRIAERPEELPFWMLNALNDYLDYRLYVPSVEEAVSVKRYLRSRGETVTLRAIAGLLGIGVEYARPLVRSVQYEYS